MSTVKEKLNGGHRSLEIGTRQSGFVPWAAVVILATVAGYLYITRPQAIGRIVESEGVVPQVQHQDQAQPQAVQWADFVALKNRVKLLEMEPINKAGRSLDPELIAAPLYPRRLTVLKEHSNMRKMPTTESRIISTFRPGDTVIVLDLLADWYEIRISDSSTGYMHRSLLGI